MFGVETLGGGPKSKRRGFGLHVEERSLGL